MIRTPIDIAIHRGVFYFEIHEGSTPWSTNDPWLTMALAVALTGASWNGHGSLEEEEVKEIQSWASEQNLLPRAQGRVVQVRRQSKMTEFLVDGVVVCSLSDLDMRSNDKWWHRVLRSIMSNAHLDYPLDLIEVDPDTGHRLRLPHY